ncbi:MAG: caspase family protein, partial [Pseudomonadota bacterium]
RHSGRRQGPDFRLVYDRLLAVSPDGTKIAFNFAEQSEIGDAILDLDLGRVTAAIGADRRKEVAEAWRSPTPPAGLKAWRVSERPTFDGRRLRLGLDERSLSADAFGDGFVVGGDRGVYVFGADGAALARLRLEVAAFGVLSLDDRRFLAAMGDGTLRWFEVEGDRIEERGAFFFARRGQRWLAWLPDGRFDHSENGGQELAGYHLNRGEKDAAEWVEFSQLYRSRYAPQVVRAALLGEAPPPIAAEAVAPSTPPRVELLEFCPVVAGVVGQCAEAQLAKRGFSAVEDAAEDGSGVSARPIPAEAEAVVLRFRVTNAEDGLSKIDVFQNRRTTGAKTRGLAPIADAANDDEPGFVIERKAPLRDGSNVLRVRVYDKRGVYGQSSELELYRPAVGEVARPNLHVLVVGANDYGGYFADLEYARRDAESIGGVVSAAPPSIYGDVSVTHLFDGEATRARIEEAIAGIAARAGEDDSVVLYFAGHGVQSEDGLYRYVTSDVGSAEELLTRSLDQEALITSLGEVKARNMLLMLDTCYSGAFPAAAAGTISNETGLMVLSASNTVEEALDGYDGNNGVFAH